MPVKITIEGYESGLTEQAVKQQIETQFRGQEDINITVEQSNE